MMPKRFIRKDGFGITPAARQYLQPLIRGEAYPPYAKDGLPKYVTIKKIMLPKKLKKFKASK